jgi:hypothetical protein
MNVPIINIFGYDGANAAARTNYVLQVGILSSVLESQVPKQMLSTPEQPAQTVSAASLLSLANHQNQKIYNITAANQAQVMPNIAHSPTVMQDIQNALAAGKNVVTHAADISTTGWTGAAYIIYDPQTGDGAYKIGGGENGSVSTFLEGAFNGAAGAALFLALFSSPAAVVTLPVFVLLITLVLVYYAVVSTELEAAHASGQGKCFDAGMDVGATLVGTVGGLFEGEFSNTLMMLIGAGVADAWVGNTIQDTQQCL